MSMAAIAAGPLLFPFRTQKISLPTLLTVLRYESPREICVAAMLTLYLNFSSICYNP